MSLRDNTERHLFYKDIYKHRGYAYIAATFYEHYDDILNFYNNRSSNAAAESLSTPKSSPSGQH